MKNRRSSPFVWTLPLVWVLAAGGMWLIRARIHWPAYVRGHTWLDGIGIASWARNLDSDIALIGLGLPLFGLIRLSRPRGAGTEGGVLADFGISGRGLLHGVGIGALIGLPMMLIGVVYASIRGTWPNPEWDMFPDLITGVIAAPLNEEFFYRGTLVFVLWRFGLARFWTLVVVSALLFGLAHVRWTADGLASGWPTVLVTVSGGAWFAWIAARWSNRLPGVHAGNLWVVIMLHGMMNASWLFFDTGDGAVGGLMPNIARVATIAFGIVLTMRYCKHS